jgi:hypothetical protein
MRDSKELLEELKQRGFDARRDETGIVTVWVDPHKDDVEAIRKLIKEKLRWERSYGFKYITRPDEWDRKPKAPDRDAYAAKTQRRKNEPRPAAVDDDQLPGQMDIFDYLRG